MSSLKLSWNSVQNAVSYNLYYNTSPGVTIGTGTLISNITDITYFHDNLQGATRYYYIVVAVDAQGNLSEPSPEFSAVGSLVSSLEVTPLDFSIPNGTSQQYEAILHFSDATSQNITSLATWDTDNHSIATIDVGGLLTGVSPGTTNVNATYQTYDGYTSVDIT